MSTQFTKNEFDLKKYLEKINFSIVNMHISPISRCILFDIQYHSLVIHNIEVTQEFGGKYIIEVPKATNMTNFVDRPIIEFEEATEWKVVKAGIEEYLSRSGWPEIYFNLELE